MKRKLKQQRDLVEALTQRLGSCSMDDFERVKAALSAEQANLKAMEG